ncbi:MAG: DUF4964 domain-containing protein, partial [Bacteroidales bacterium]|nr:DUF4964 domain-containing protein [Bacteroidales bacterium]
MLLTATAQTADMFKPYKPTALRLPSVPLVLSDPYFSIWSPYDCLTEGSTRHWTGDEKPLEGLLRVDGTVYRWMGKQETYILSNPLLPMASDAAWTALTHIGAKPNGAGMKWTQTDYESSEYYNADEWSQMQGAFGCPKGKYTGGTCNEDWHTNIHTEWYQTGTSNGLYIRRHMTLTADDLKKDLYIKYSHDDYFFLYINGHRMVNTGYNWAPNIVQRISDDDKQYLHEGDHVVAVYCYNHEGGAYCDFGIYENIKTDIPDEVLAQQTNCDVLACNTFYNFTCGPVDLDVVFTAPMGINDLELISTPINYISYRVRSNDGQPHSVQFFYGFTPEMTVFDIVTTR